MPEHIEEPVFVRVATVDALEANESVRNAVVVDLLPRRGNAERVRDLGAVGYLGAPTSSTELDAVLTQVQSGDFTTRYVISAPSVALRVLAADDAPSNQLLVERVLTRRGHHVVSVADGAAALTAMDSHKFDVVLLDGHMPIMGGIEVTREIRRRDALAGEHTPVIVVSGRTSPEEQAEAMEAGADLCVTKPFDVRKLQDVVEKLGIRSNTGPDSAERWADDELHGPRAQDRPVQSPVVDRDAFNVQVGGIVDFAGEIVESVRAEWEELAPLITRDALRADMSASQAAAHRLKGVLALVGATRARELAGRIEKACTNGDLESAAAMAEALAATMVATDSELQAVLDDMEPAGR